MCWIYIYHWYFRNKLTTNKKKSAVMIIGSEMQLQSLNLDQFSINLESDKIELVNKAKYLGLLVKDDLSWDEHILQLCKNMNYYPHVLRRLNDIFPKQLLLKVYKSYIQSKLDYGLSIWGCTTEGNLDHVKRIQNCCGRIICNDYDYVNTRGTDLVKSLKLQTIRERKDYFRCVFMLKCIHGLAPDYLSNDVTVVVDTHGYNTKGVPKIWIYTYQVVQKNFVNVVSNIKTVCCEKPCPISRKNPAHLIYLKATIVSSLVDKSLEYIWIYLSVDLHFLILHIFP